MKKSFILFLLICFNLFSQDSINENSAIYVDFAQQQLVKDYNPIFHFPPVNQDTTSICWSFSTLSFIESEMKRFGREEVKLSVNYPVYYGFIEKAKYFIQRKGKSRFKAGDLFGTVINVIKQYGIVPEKNYTGKLTQKKTYNHKQMYDELYAYMENVKKDSLWNEKIAIEKVKEIMNNHIGNPPKEFTYNNKKYTPIEFANEIVGLHWEDYVKITSFKSSEFFKQMSLNVPDNWLPDNNYFNVPLELFNVSLRTALQNNFSMAIDGDLSEPGRIGEKDICIIPEYDIPSIAITQDAREYRFEKELTTDDHLMHIIGYQNINGKDWYLVKDSWRDAFEGYHKGYFFMTDDYIKLKILAYLIHKDAIPEIMKQIIN
jgi:bleomycin hydrolase